MAEKIKWIIFDFDNTLVDALTLWISAYNQAALRYGCKIIKPEDHSILRSKSAWEIRKALGVSLFKAPFLRTAVRKIFAKNLAQLRFHPGMESLIKDFYTQGFTLGIYSSNRKENISQFLENQDCLKYFQFIKAEASLFFKGWQLKKLIKEQKINPAQAVYIGDETKDIDAAHQAKIKSAAVTWGVNSKSALLAHGPDFLANTPDDLLKFFTL